MEGESAARRVQSGGKGEVVIPYPKEEIRGQQQCATNEECLPSAHQVGRARGALGVHSSSSVHHGSPFCADSTYPRGLYRISNRGQRLYQTRVGSGSSTGGSVNEIRRMPQQFAYLGLYQLGYTIATFGSGRMRCPRAAQQWGKAELLWTPHQMTFRRAGHWWMNGGRAGKARRRSRGWRRHWRPDRSWLP